MTQYNALTGSIGTVKWLDIMTEWGLLYTFTQHEKSFDSNAGKTYCL